MRKAHLISSVFFSNDWKEEIIYIFCSYYIRFVILQLYVFEKLIIHQTYFQKEYKIRAIEKRLLLLAEYAVWSISSCLSADWNHDTLAESDVSTHQLSLRYIYSKFYFKRTFSSSSMSVIILWVGHFDVNL